MNLFQRPKLPMRINWFSFCVILVAALSGCMSLDRTKSTTRRLQLGMSKEEVIKVMGRPEVEVPGPAAEILSYTLTKTTGDEPYDDFGRQVSSIGAPSGSSRVRSPRPYRLQIEQNRLVAFGISTELEPEKIIPNKAIELGLPNDNHWKTYEVKTVALRLGMTKEEMIKILGQPDSFGANKQFEYFNYLRHSNGEGGERRYKLRAYIARFSEGRLERFWCEAF